MSRLKELRKQAHVSQVELSKAIGIAQPTLSGWESGRYQIDDNSKIKLAEYFNVSVDYLMGRQTPPQVTQGIKIPIYGSVAAGIPLEAVECIEGYEEITPALAGKGEYFGLKIHGQSMSPFLLDGDVVIVRRQNTAVTDDVAIVMVNGDEATCKLVKFDSTGLTLVAYNPIVFPPKHFTNEEIATLPVKILGKVVEVKRTLE